MASGKGSGSTGTIVASLWTTAGSSSGRTTWACGTVTKVTEAEVTCSRLGTCAVSATIAECFACTASKFTGDMFGSPPPITSIPICSWWDRIAAAS